MRRFSAMVEDVREQQRIGGRAVWQLALSQTWFGPGQEGNLMAISRLGSRLVLRVRAVEQHGGTVWHTVDKPLAAGTEVTGEVE